MLSALFERNIGSTPWAAANDQGWGVWPGDTAGNTYSGVAVDEKNAPALLTVYGAASFITDEISTLPVDAEGSQVRPVWIDRPSAGLGRIEWLGQIVWSLLLNGNAYLLARYATNGRVLELDVVNPDRVVVRRVNGRPAYFIDGQALENCVHIPGRMLPGDVVGMSPVEYTRQTIGAGLAAQRYGAEFWANEGSMPGVIELPHPANPETTRELAAQWQRKRRTSGRGLPGVLQAGAQWKPTGVTNEQAQFLSTRKWTAAEIAGQIFMLDPSDLGIPVEGSNLTYANLQQRNVRRLQVALMPWIRRIEAALSPLVAGGAYKFDVDSRLRGNTRESYETLAVATSAGIMSKDEARDVLGLEGPAPAEPVPVIMTPEQDDQ